MRKKIFYILFFGILLSQPDPQFGPFDWVLYTRHGSINSISEGYNYAYFATENGGLLRYNLYSDRFDEPITSAQGLSENQLTAVYFDKSTGILWTASNNYINYSFSAAGDWNIIKYSDLGLRRSEKIQMIGASSNYIWLYAVNSYVKIDKVSGVSFGIYPSPDEQDIDWSSNIMIGNLIPDEFQNYDAMEGWLISYAHFIDPYGKWIDLSSYYYGQNKNIFIGLEDGTIFIGETTNEQIYPYEISLNQSIINKMSDGTSMWLVGDSQNNVGVTQYYTENEEFYNVDYENEINFNPGSYYSIVETKNEVWIGSSSKISIYNKKKDFWREIGEEHGLPNAIIIDMVEDETSIWVGTDRGLYEISKHNKYVVENDLKNKLRLEKINSLELVDGKIWIATVRNLFLFDKENNTLSNFKNIGRIDNMKNRISSFVNFSDISHSGRNIYFSTNNGVITYNLDRESWNIAVEPSLYGGSNIYTLVVEDGYCFLGTDSGLWQLDMRGGYSRLFDYNFIGRVNDLLIEEDRLYIGSTSGFIKYLWKKIL